MEPAYYPQAQNDLISKKDKKRATVQNKLNKIDEGFKYEKDYHYRTMLQDLQRSLSTIHQGTNEVLVERVKDFEERRDYDLVELRLWEEYQVKRTEREFTEEVEKANNEHDEMVKLVKEKLYANLEKQIKLLKEDKILLDLANSHSYNMDTTLTNQNDYHKNTRSSNSLKDSSISSIGYLSDRRGLRRREPNYNSTNNDDSHLSANDSGNNSSSKKRRKPNGTGNSSAEETYQSDAGDLSSILFGEKPEKVHTRHSSKAFVPPIGLKTEEINDDLALMKK
ncbi:Transcriptional regulatory protein [Wickerhamomyces ciferrii]|uniref:Transcriptional regulatory protein n=1 Tax=Wickerhamomyces ciferrii (strain ATCC 14091 / BCRC 22168 / CBS 111 / JCM 3599 / NBRC 0793 / NRRL Y-1031 F-60-10) TaxID=1206466 RepID=K0KGE5_WICCF|nr:Transcriptional regulatory protein [Wickerhamomyces ciferrii]CCH42036.1 Transcriptional regulatory protein [Wickerhamomyces ciferrii]